MHKYILLISLITELVFSMDTGVLDKTHKDISNSVKSTSKYIDNKLYRLFNDIDETTDINQSKINNKMDSFYQNEKFIDETDISFLRIRMQSNSQTLESNNFDIKLMAYLALSKTKQNLKFFIEDVNKDNIKDLPFTNSTNPDSAIAIGLSYFTSIYYNIDSKYSIGMRDIYPYIKARYKKNFIYNNISIEPSQTFKYSTKNNFSENTKIYIDKKIDNHLYRIILARGTKSITPGMDYSLNLEYFYQIRKNTGIRLVQSFSGNTKYTYIDKEKIIYYKNINTYNTEISFRQNIWKKWFFYEIKPGIDFQKQYNFKINYKILLLTDFYFGY